MSSEIIPNHEDLISGLDFPEGYLNEDEMAVLMQTLNEFATDGKSEMYDQLYASDYEEIPISIQEFITNRDYLGSSLMNDDNSSSVYNYWQRHLNEAFAPDSKYYEFAMSGAIGLGKSTIACVGLAYVLYKLLCLRNPASFYKLAKGSKIGIALFNINMTQSFGVGYYKLQSFLKESPWFRDHGTITGVKYPTYYPDKNIEIIVGSQMEHFLGRDIFAAFMDEMEFAPGADKRVEVSKIMKLYNTIKRRMESRYMKLGQLPGMLFLVSSKRSDQDFLENYIKKNRHKPYLMVSDDPIWVVKSDQGLYSGKVFPVVIGNRYVPSKIIEEEEIQSYRDNGLEVIEVPVEYREAFEADINTAIADIAGKALSSSLKFIYYDKLKYCYREYLKNPFPKSIIQLGFDDDTEIKDFMDEKLLSTLDRSKPHFFHWDTSKNGDCSGLAMGTIAGHKEIRRLQNGQMFDTNDIIHKITLGVKIQAMPGNEIPFYKIRNFIYYLKFELGYNIISTTCDSYQSVDTLQQFKLRGFLADTLSVDRTRSPYESLKNAINESRFISPYIDEMERELLDLEDDKITGKIDHPTGSSKDLSDAIAAVIHRSLDYKKLLSELNKMEDTQILVAVNSNNNSSNGDWLMGGRRVID